MTTPPESPRRSHWPLVAVVIVALLATGRGVGNDWSFYDDDLFIARNEQFNPPTLDGLASGWTQPFRGLWTPVTHTAWWLVAHVALLDQQDAQGIRLNPWMFHALNVLVHATTSALAYVLIRRLVRTASCALAGAILFAAHPVQVEAVAWVCGTKDLLAGLLTIASIAVAFSAMRGAVFAAVLLAAMAMLSKPSAAVLPAMLVVFNWACGPESSPARSPWATRAMIGVVALMAAVVAIVARRVQDVGDVPPVGLLARSLVALDALAVHLWHVAWPLGLCADYGLTPTELLASSRRWGTWLVPLALALAAWRSRDRVLVGGALLFAIALAPNLGLAGFQFQVYSTVADRYAYVAMLGAGVVVARVAEIVQERLRPRIAFVTPHVPTWSYAAILALPLIVLSIRQCGRWANAESLWSLTLSVNPQSSLAHNNLGAALAGRGESRAAIGHFKAAAVPGAAASAYAWLNLAQLYLRVGEPDAAADAVVELVGAYRARREFDAELTLQIVDRFARQIERQSPAAATRLRAKVGL